MDLSPLEKDFLEALELDAHELWELYRYVRRDRPAAPDAQVRRLGNELLSQWVARRWVRAFRSRRDARPLAGKELLFEVNKLGLSALEPENGRIVLELTEQAAKDLGWLKPNTLGS